MSIGVVEIHSDDAPASFVGHAGQALSHAKKSGKNRTCIYEGLVREGLLKNEIKYGKIEIF